LYRVNRELEEFTYMASHELREPLRMVNIYTQLLFGRCGPALDAQAHEFAEHIHHSVARMERLIQDVLKYSETIHNSNERPVKPVDVRSALDHALVVFRNPLQAAGAQTQIGSLPRVLAEERQLALVFEHLLSNSLKYADPGRPLSLRIWSRRRGEKWAIYFADNGAGIGAQFTERIFGLFKRLHGRDVPGTGLGLAICRRIIERFGGEIWADKQAREGALIIFTLKGCDLHESGFQNPAGGGQSG
jgi:light-regulated signal transduction histidine kinase (bacteriophytochrome)